MASLFPLYQPTPAWDLLSTLTELKQQPPIPFFPPYYPQPVLTLQEAPFPSPSEDALLCSSLFSAFWSSLAARSKERGAKLGPGLPPTRAREKEKVGKGRGELGMETLEDPQSTGLKSKYISCMGRRSITTIRTSLMSHFVARVWF